MPIKINKFYLPLLPLAVVVVVVVAVTFIVLPGALATVALALHFKELLLRRSTILFNLLKSRGSINAHQYAKRRGGGEEMERRNS